MELSRTSESDSHSASYEIPLLFMDSKYSLLCSQQPAHGPYPEPLKTSPHPQTLFP